MPRKANKDVIRNILLNADTPLSAEDISLLWPYNGGMSTAVLAQILSRMRDIKKVGRRNTASITNDSYPVDTWSHVNHERYAEWVDEGTNE